MTWHCSGFEITPKIVIRLKKDKLSRKDSEVVKEVIAERTHVQGVTVQLVLFLLADVFFSLPFQLLKWRIYWNNNTYYWLYDPTSEKTLLDQVFQLGASRGSFSPCLVLKTTRNWDSTNDFIKRHALFTILKWRRISIKSTKRDPPFDKSLFGEFYPF